MHCISWNVFYYHQILDINNEKADFVCRSPLSLVVELKFGISSLVQQPAFAEASAGEDGQRGTAFELFLGGFEGDSLFLNMAGSLRWTRYHVSGAFFFG